LAHCYASDLSRLILDRQPGLWVHGHLHSRLDYAISDTRIVCNARGHVDEASEFDPAFTVSLGAGAAS
jgi:Icc-related predicted phosphoesterase